MKSTDKHKVNDATNHSIPRIPALLCLALCLTLSSLVQDSPAKTRLPFPEEFGEVGAEIAKERSMLDTIPGFNKYGYSC